jgi:hypothetical protein
MRYLSSTLSGLALLRGLSREWVCGAMPTVGPCQHTWQFCFDVLPTAVGWWVIGVKVIAAPKQQGMQ